VTRAGGEDQGIVGELTVLEKDSPAGQVHPFGLRQEDRHVSRIAQDRADRARDVRRRQPRRGHLVEERLEQVMVSAVHDGDANGMAGQPARRVQTAEAAPDDHDVRRGDDSVSARRSHP
jgi:hypothetical protein